MDDEKIIEMLFSRAEESISVIDEKYGAACKKIAKDILGNEQDAEECENDTYLQAWDSIPPNEPRDYLFAFLARIIRHISLDCCRYRERLRRKAHVQELSDELLCMVSGKEDVDSRMDAIVLGESISAFLRVQPAQIRNVFIRRYWYLDSIEDICLRYSISQSKAKSMLFRCRNGLRNHLRKEGFTL